MVVPRAIRVAHKRLTSDWRTSKSCARPIELPPRGGNPHDGEIITHAPNLMWGMRCVRRCSRWFVRLGLELHRRRHWNAGSVVGWSGVWQARRPLYCSRSPWGLPGCMASTAAGARSGAGLCGCDHGSQYLIGPLHQPDRSSVAPAGPRLRRRAPDQRRRRAVQSHA